VIYQPNQSISLVAMRPSSAVGPKTLILPLLDGTRHLDFLETRFGRDRVLGGQCVIAAALDKHHAIVLKR